MVLVMNAMNTTAVFAVVSLPIVDEVEEVEEALPESWFDSKPRLSTAPPPAYRSSLPPVPVGDFLGDELADAWLR